MGRMIRHSGGSKKSSSYHSRKKKTNGTLSSTTPPTAVVIDDEVTNQSWVDRLRLVPIEMEDVPEEDWVIDTSATTGTTTPTATTTTTTTSSSSNHSPPITISILTWNVLAQAYCSRRSQVQLPKEYGHVVFHKTKRRQRILQLLQQLSTTTGTRPSAMDIVCLQEVDMNEIRPVMGKLGYCSAVETPRCVRANNTTMGGRIDGCAIYIRTHRCRDEDEDDEKRSTDDFPPPSNEAKEAKEMDDTPPTVFLDGILETTDDTLQDSDDHHLAITTTTKATTTVTTATNDNTQEKKEETTSNVSAVLSNSSQIQWKLIDSELIRLDDLATLSSSSTTTNTSNHQNEKSPPDGNTNAATTKTTNGTNHNNNNNYSNIQGIQQSLLRRNMAIMIRLQHTVYPERTIIVINAHLFWNPSFEYVKVGRKCILCACVYSSIVLHFLTYPLQN